MSADHVIRGSAFIQAARLRRLACFLLAESPAEAEANARMPTEVLDVIAHGDGVIRFESAPEPHYMVIRNGTRYLTSTPPHDVDESEIRGVHLPPRTGRNVFRRFRRLSRQLAESDPLVHEWFRFEEIANVIDAEFPRRGPAPDVMRAIRPALLLTSPDAPKPPPDLTSSDAQASAWLNAMIEYLKREYALNRVAGDTVRNVLAVLLYLNLSPDPGRRMALQRTATGLDGLVLSGAPSHWLPDPDLESYLLSPGLRIPQVVIPVRQLALFLTRTADQQRTAASGAPTMELFHGQLFGALLLYRTAQRVFDAIDRVLGPVPEDVIPSGLLDRQALRVRARHCEEMRVHIYLSLATAAGVRTGAPDPTNRRSLREYLTTLARLTLPSAERDVMDLGLRMYIPDIVRQWLKGWLWMFHPESEGDLPAEGARLVMDVIERLEQHAHGRAMLGEPPLIAIGYGWLAADARRRGDRKRAREFAGMAQPAATQALSFDSAVQETMTSLAYLRSGVPPD
jgi:hypothetical protein